MAGIAVREGVNLVVDPITGFDTNDSRIRAETRVLLALTAPGSIVEADLTA